MRQATTQKYRAATQGLAQRYNVQTVRQQFNVEPTIEQRLYDGVYETSEFLRRINTQMVDELVGKDVTLSIDNSITGRAGVESDNDAERSTHDPSGLGEREYRCYAVECDVHMTWQQMDNWAKYPDFHVRWRNHVKKRNALDIIKVGWNGIKAAPKTDLATNPMLEDLNIGWLQLVRRDAPELAIRSGQVDSQIRIGLGGDYANLDQAVFDLQQAIPLHKRDGLIAIIGSELIAHAQGNYYASQAETPSEKEKIELAQVIKTYGGLMSFQVPFFPPRGIMVTAFDNLSHLIQSGSTRMHIIDNPKKKRVEDYQSRNDCFYVNDLEKIAFFESDAVKIRTLKAGSDDEWEWT
ncbi:phage major capsid protein, P2 family [Algicola sagamiensis]|uniref:phage major capsid protein, P2 family n=1 Tax=Algicola sagamiensis TaxID=163869 RepID=UPI0003696EB8|nr:phage major capsid protein, P2 family [Algicola sagamiensis]